LKTWYLQFFIFVRRLSAGTWLLAFIWCLVFSLTFTWVALREVGQRNTQKMAALQEDVQRLSTTQQIGLVAADTGAANAQKFLGILGNASDLQEHLKKIFEIARKKNLTFPTGSYKTSRNVAGGYDTYVVELPITGSYLNIRELSEEVLLALPFSALEEMKFKRDNSGSATLEVRLRFVLFLRPDDQRPSAPTSEKLAQ
jgi:hypothetical protein